MYRSLIVLHLRKHMAIVVVAGKKRWIGLPVSSYALAVQPVVDCAAAPEPPARQLPWTSRGAGHGGLIVRSATVLSIAFVPRSGQPAAAAAAGALGASRTTRCQDFRKRTVNHSQRIQSDET